MGRKLLYSPSMRCWRIRPGWRQWRGRKWSDSGCEYILRAKFTSFAVGSDVVREEIGVKVVAVQNAGDEGRVGGTDVGERQVRGGGKGAQTKCRFLQAMERTLLLECDGNPGRVLNRGGLGSGLCSNRNSSRRVSNRLWRGRDGGGQFRGWGRHPSER